jgi:hypothetical protein
MDSLSKIAEEMTSMKDTVSSSAGASPFRFVRTGQPQMAKVFD